MCGKDNTRDTVNNMVAQSVLGDLTLTGSSKTDRRLLSAYPYFVMVPTVCSPPRVQIPINPSKKASAAASSTLSAPNREGMLVNQSPKQFRLYLGSAVVIRAEKAVASWLALLVGGCVGIQTRQRYRHTTCSCLNLDIFLVEIASGLNL